MEAKEKLPAAYDMEQAAISMRSFRVSILNVSKGKKEVAKVVYHFGARCTAL